MSRAFSEILETSLSKGFLGVKEGNWTWLGKSGGAPLDLLSSGEIFPCFYFFNLILKFQFNLTVFGNL